LLDRESIERLIPHSGPMVLLDHVISYDERHVLCTTLSHRAADNPLCRGGRLPAVCGVEYGAQAAAVHGPLVEGHAVQPGQIVLLRHLAWTRPFLDDIEDRLEVRAECLHRDRRELAYGFSIHAKAAEIMSGEIGIILS